MTIFCNYYHDYDFFIISMSICGKTSFSRVKWSGENEGGPGSRSEKLAINQFDRNKRKEGDFHIKFVYENIFMTFKTRHTKHGGALKPILGRGFNTLFEH